MLSVLIVLLLVVCLTLFIIQAKNNICISVILEIASEGLKGRVFEVSLADLQNDEIAFRKFRLIAEEVQGKNVLTNFHGMDLTTDKLRSMVKKWQVITLILLHLNHLLKYVVLRSRDI